jgi:long-chain acyl-CoA synthetase
MRWFDPAGWLTLAAQHKISISPLVPSMLQMLLQQPLEDYDLSALARLTSGAAPLPPQVTADFARRLPGVEVAEGYGCTETAAIISTSPVGAARLGSVGQPAPGVEVRIERPDGTPAGAGEDGEICVRGPVVMSGYWNAPAETGQAMRGGWLHTGDVGRLDDGYLYIVDRIKDLIIRGGYNVYPRDVEDVLVQHPDVVAAAVVGRPDDKYGEEVVAFVQLRAGATTEPAELVGFAKEHLSAVKYPREVRVIDAIPLTSVLKTDRKRLRAQLAAD